ncbi:MAG: hypothetical protein ABI693_10840 [Bryobacteraceae bacterium]
MRRYAVVLALCVVMCAGASGQSATCSVNGNTFNLQAPANAVGQYNETVAVLPGAALNGGDLVIGTALDARSLPPLGFLPGQNADAFYVQRGNANCSADLEGELPGIQSNTGDFYSIFGDPVVVADPARHAFFIADLRLGPQIAVGLMKATPATLLNTTNCPSGTVPNAVPCFVPVAQLANLVSSNTSSGLFSPSIAVDQRATGTGAGDIYIVVAQNNQDGSATTISLSTCSNALSNCSNQVKVSGADTRTYNPWVQVRPDGGITISYVQRDANTPTTALELRFVTCQPGGSPQPPVCAAPVAVLHESQPAGLPGEVELTPQYVNPISIQTTDPTYPKHVNRLESDGSTVTTFLVYDRCGTPTVTGGEIFFPLCAKTDVVLTTSTDGVNWSPLQKVSNAAGQQFFGHLALDASTGVVNIAYYSTENDPLKTSMQVFLAQVAKGDGAPGTPRRVTQSLYDGPLGGFNGAGLPGGYLGIAAGGGHTYIHYTGSIKPGNYNGVLFPVANNILTGVLQ